MALFIKIVSDHQDEIVQKNSPDKTAVEKLVPAKYYLLVSYKNVYGTMSNSAVKIH